MGSYVQRLAVHLPDGRGYYVGSTLVALDRELRRVAREFRDDDDVQLTPVRVGRMEMVPEPGRAVSRSQRREDPPDRPDRSSLRLISATEGSVDLWLEPIGGMIAVMASTPIIALVNSATLLGGAHNVRIWLGRQFGQLAQLLGADVSSFERLVQQEAQPFGRADINIDLGSDLGINHGSIRANGRRITYFRQSPDGTLDAVVVE